MMRKVKYWLWTLTAFVLAPQAFGQSDWSSYEETIRGALDVTKKSVRGGGELVFGLAPVVALFVGGLGVWFGAKKKAEREDKDTKVMPLIWGVIGAVLSFGLVLLVYIGLEAVGIPARQKAMDFWTGGG